jgi:hypothetical protein
LRRGDLPGRGWRAANKVGQFGWLGQIFAADNLPASCEDAHKRSEPLVKRGGASAFRRRSEIVGYEHGAYANVRQSRQTLSSAVSARGIRCLARLMTSTRFHTHVKFARYTPPGLAGVTLWRLVVQTRAADRITGQLVDIVKQGQEYLRSTVTSIGSSRAATSRNAPVSTSIVFPSDLSKHYAAKGSGGTILYALRGGEQITVDARTRLIRSDFTPAFPSGGVPAYHDAYSYPGSIVELPVPLPLCH